MCTLSVARDDRGDRFLESLEGKKNCDGIADRIEKKAYPEYAQIMWAQARHTAQSTLPI